MPDSLDLRQAVACLQRDVAVIKDRGVRVEESLERIEAEQRSVRTKLDQQDGAQSNQGMLGHFVTGAVAIGAALVTMWSGVFSSGHH